ncbi:MAG: PIG-L family deacetylase [Bacteroidetes bacterium]|nr:PIG-L family deacetylase [Bacteroidota bacterium]
MKKLILFSALLFHSHLFLAQQKTLNSSEILLGLQKLNTLGSVLYIAAHPDDENTRLISYLANEKKLRVGYLSLTRGDGGQNLIGKEQGDALGLIRTQELLAARKIDGAEQFFTRAVDFGFSKTPEETFEFWNKDSILSDVVRIIRTFKPDVIICRFPTTGEGGHGHHTASAILALEAYDAAADKTKFPEQLNYLQTWQARRIFWNTFNFGTTNTTAENQLKMDVGGFNPLLGKSYGEIAAESRSMHKSQGMGAAKQRGSNFEYFKLLKGEPATNDLFEGINQTWTRFAETAPLQKMIDSCITNFNPQKSENSVNSLIKIYSKIKELDETNADIYYWQSIKWEECENLLRACTGLFVEVYADNYSAIPNSKINITAQIVMRNNCNIEMRNVLNTLFSVGGCSSNDTVTDEKFVLKQNQLYTFKYSVFLNSEAKFSNPYWLNEKHNLGIYTVSNRHLLNYAEVDWIGAVTLLFTINDVNFPIFKNLTYKSTDPIKGEVYRPLEILPPATINIPEKVFVFTDKKPKTVQIVVKANTNNVKGYLQLVTVNNGSITAKNSNFTLTAKGDEAVIEATITPPKNFSEGKLLASVNIDGKTYNQSIQRIEYDHIPHQFILSDAEAKLVYVDLKKTGTKIGYIPGAGDDVAECLTQVGFNVTILTDELLAKENLSKYNAIVTGIRAYNTNERLPLFNDKLFEYVKNGGNLIVQYNTNSRAGALQAKIGMYPFTVSRDRVTDENSEVKFLNPNHAALNTPNKITEKDFENWVQERGIYFATDIDKNYETILSMHDKGEKEHNGSLIIAKYGKGNFVYTGLAFFRELPAGVPGAYRLFTNLLNLPKN